jgi:hypothetical protein
MSHQPAEVALGPIAAELLQLEELIGSGQVCLSNAASYTAGRLRWRLRASRAYLKPLPFV